MLAIRWKSFHPQSIFRWVNCRTLSLFFPRSYVLSGDFIAILPYFFTHFVFYHKLWRSNTSTNHIGLHENGSFAALSNSPLKFSARKLSVRMTGPSLQALAKASVSSPSTVIFFSSTSSQWHRLIPCIPGISEKDK